MKQRPTKLYLVWNTEDAISDPDGAYFEQFDTVEDAVSSRDEPVEVYVAEIKPLGRFKIETKAVKLPKPKPKPKRKAKR